MKSIEYIYMIIYWVDEIRWYEYILIYIKDYNKLKNKYVNYNK
jgi:hypothetical protein